MEKLPSSKEKGNTSSIAKVIALSAMLFLSNPESKAQEAKNTEPLKENYQELVTRAHMLQDSLYRKLIDLRGGFVHTSDKIGFEQTTTGYKIYFTPGDSKRPLATSLISDGDSVRIVYVDRNADGQVDKIYFYKNAKSELERNMDDLKIKNLSIDKINDDRFAQNLMGQDITVVEISSSNGGYETQLFDFKDKKKRSGKGEVAKKFTYGIQEIYNNSLDGLAR